MKLKVLFVLTNMNIGGTEKSFLNLLYTLNPNEYDVTLLLLEKTGGYLEDVPSWVRVLALDGYLKIKPEIMDPPLAVAKQHVKNGRIYRALGIAFNHVLFKLTKDRTAYYRYVLKDTKNIPETYDIAVAYAGPMDFITNYVLEHLSARKKIQWIHFDVSKFGLNIEFAKHNYPKFDKVYVVSDAAKEQLLNLIPEIADITETRHNVVSKDQCLKEAEKDVGFTDDFKGIRILTVGRLSKEKGQEIIPDVAKKLKEAGYHFRWYLIGSGKTEEEIRRKISDYHLEENVILLGTIKNPFPYYAQCDLYVQTSLHEGYCISLAEAQVFNKPIVSTDVAGARDLLTGDKKARVVNYSAEELYNTLAKLFAEKNTNKLNDIADHEG